MQGRPSPFLTSLPDRMPRPFTPTGRHQLPNGHVEQMDVRHASLPTPSLRFQCFMSVAAGWSVLCLNPGGRLTHGALLLSSIDPPVLSEQFVQSSSRVLGWGVQASGGPKLPGKQAAHPPTSGKTDQDTLLSLGPRRPWNVMQGMAWGLDLLQLGVTEKTLDGQGPRGSSTRVMCKVNTWS